MENKQEVLQYIKNLAAEKVVSREELVSAYDAGGGLAKAKRFGMSEILYYIGGMIVFLGIAILIEQNWSALSIITKILATLGSSIAAYFVGMAFSREKRFENVGSAFYLISALVMPIGLYVVFDNAGFDLSSLGIQSLVFAILLFVYYSSYFLFKKNIFLLFSIIFGTILYFCFTGFLVGNNIYFNDSRFYEYRILAAGLAYMLLGYSFMKTERAALTGFLSGFGVLGFLGAALSLGGWTPNQNAFWELAFPVLIFTIFYISTKIRSRSYLVFGTLFLMGDIMKITSEYFANSLGWPLALVIAGLLIIASGYASIYLGKRYISKVA